MAANISPFSNESLSASSCKEKHDNGNSSSPLSLANLLTQPCDIHSFETTEDIIKYCTVEYLKVSTILERLITEFKENYWGKLR